jgi:hypothetical protein
MNRFISFVTFTSLIFASCGMNEFRDQERKLNPLLAEHAPKSEVVALLGSDFLDYSKGKTNWETLTEILSREPPSRLQSVRQNAAKWPHAMLYSSSTMMTWIFLDEKERVSAFVVGAQ